MKKLKRIINIFIVVVLLLVSMLGLFQNESKAATYLIKEADLYSKGEMVCFSYKGNLIGVEFVVYKKDGVEYPAYCLNRTLIGVTTHEGAKVKVNKALENAAVWRAVVNGYPFKTPSELKCNNAEEAFAATKMAVYDALYTYDWSDFTPSNEQGRRVIEAAESISKKARSSKETKISGKVEIKKVTNEWKRDDIEENYISRVYKVQTNAESTKYNLQLGAVSINGMRITDMKNNNKTEFKSGETFKVLIPTSEIEIKFDVNREFNITATANLKTKPVLYGETANSNYQNYALAAGEWEFEKTLLQEQYPSNKTKIKILKEDTETKKALEGAKFNVLDKNKNIIYADVITNAEGVVELNGIIPGKYYIEEIESPNGYTKYEELIEVDVAFNEIYTVKVNNYKKPKEEEKQVEEEKEKEVTGKKEIALPRTGF